MAKIPFARFWFRASWGITRSKQKAEYENDLFVTKLLREVKLNARASCIKNVLRGYLEETAS
jgi:hypothetical protein